MRCFDGFFMANSLSDPRDLLISFFGKVTRTIPLRPAGEPERRAGMSKTVYG
jgi:hypothetical protein